MAARKDNNLDALKRREAVILLAAVVLIVVFWMLLAWDLRGVEARAYADADRMNAGLATAYAERSEGRLRAVERTSADLARAAAGDPARVSEAMLAAAATALGDVVVALHVVDRRGVVVLSQPAGAAVGPVARAMAQASGGGGDPRLIAIATDGGPDSALIAVTTRLMRNAASDGAVVALISRASLREVIAFHPPPPGTEARIAIAGAGVVARSETAVVGAAEADFVRALDAAVASAPVGLFHLPGTQSEDLLVSYRASPRLGHVVALVTPMDRVLAAYRTNRNRALVIGSLLSALVLAIGALMSVTQRRTMAATLAMAESERRTTEALRRAEHSNAELQRRDHETQLARETLVDAIESIT
ncbi:MAG: hypothetical protein FJX57_23835, partial [Alphaproteobacteria bacterium]|nr:hypothetical protein [Alphaproteobacteria bacterium]